MQQLKNFFKEHHDLTDEDVPEEEKRMFVDNTNVCGIVPLKKKTRQQIKEVFDCTEASLPKENILKYTAKTRFSITYLRLLLKLLEASDYESVLLELGADMPLRATTPEWELYIAPRVDN